ncbi:MAG: CotH kinase family protein [Clostridiales bacterium]|nr:CotH kinase family protein [Clostridiales bacterium]
MTNVTNRYRLIARCFAIILVAVCLFNFVSCASKHIHGYGEWEVVEEATCEDDGLKARTCECGHTEEKVIPMLGHDYAIDYGYPATCTATGLTDGVRCSRCGEVLLEQKVIPKTAHVLEDIEAKPPTFTQTGLTAGKRCSVCGEIIAEQHIIEKLKEQDFGYKVEIGSDEHVSVYVYTTQDYTVQPMLSNVAFARDSSSGELLKNGNGQVNFKLVFDDGYYLKDIKVTSGYKALKTPEDTGNDDTYRITKITRDLVVFVESQNRPELAQFASVTDDDGNVEFSWARDARIEYTRVRVLVGEQYTDYVVENGANKWVFASLEQDVVYQFEFTPFDEDDNAGETTVCSRYFNPSVKSASFPRIEITTEDHIWPTCDYVDAPAGAIGSTIINNNYVQSIVSIYDGNNGLLYTSSDSNDFSSSKIKLRGNTSAYYGEKKPYKIKLNKKADLLAGLLQDRSDKSYAHKDWILLKSGYSMNTLVGWSVSEMLEMDYTPAYSYVACYVNGDYRGLYILCESVSKGNGSNEEQARIAIDDDGYIVELDAYWWKESLSFETDFTVSHMRYTFKYPDSDDISAESAETQYIRDYILGFEAALVNDDNSYLDYIDERSFAKWMVAQDLLASWDAAGTNMFLVKKDSTAESKLTAALIWDLDGAFSELSVNKFSDIRQKPYFYCVPLLKKQSFVDIYKSLFEEVKDNISSDISSNAQKVNADGYDYLISVENTRWTDANYGTLQNQISEKINWMQRHLDFLTDNI